jgi:hypothetical protein
MWVGGLQLLTVFTSVGLKLVTAVLVISLKYQKWMITNHATNMLSKGTIFYICCHNINIVTIVIGFASMGGSLFGPGQA